MFDVLRPVAGLLPARSPRWVIACLAVAACAVSGPGWAQLTVNRSVIEFSPDERIQDIEVTNTGDFRLYLDMAVAEIERPESADPTRVSFDDPRTSPVLVTPRQLLVPPGERKRVRIVMRDVGGDAERVFRLSIKPYTGKVRIEGGDEDGKASAVKVLVGYDLLLLARPADPVPKLEVTRTDRTIEFRNEGNTNILLRQVRQCDRAMRDCVDLSANRLYAGEAWTLDLPRSGPASDHPVEVFSAVGLSNSRAVH